MAYALFQITLKSLVIKNDKILTLTTQDKFVDFPGGRIDKDEYELNFDQIIARELKEELNTNSFKITDLAFVCKRKYDFKGLHYVLAIYYNVEIYDDFNLSSEHINYEWLTASELIARQKNLLAQMNIMS